MSVFFHMFMTSTKFANESSKDGHECKLIRINFQPSQKTFPSELTWMCVQYFLFLFVAGVISQGGPHCCGSMERVAV